MLTSISFPSLANNSGDLNMLYNAVLTSISFPSLTDSKFLGISNNASVSTISFPALNHTNQFYIQSNATLSSINIPVLNTTTAFQISSNPLLTSLSAPSLSNAGTSNLSVSFNGVTSISLPALTTFGAQFSTTNNKLTVASVNALLNKLASIPGLTGKSIYLYGQTPAGPPSGQGITDKNTLISNGNRVTTD